MEGSGEKGEHSLIEKLMDTKETQQGELRLKIVWSYVLRIDPLICEFFENTYSTLHILYIMHI